MALQWTSRRGEVWQCGKATGSFSNSTFTIEEFGTISSVSHASALISAAIEQFDDSTIRVDMSDSTRPVLEQLKADGTVNWKATPGMRDVRIVGVS